MFKYCILLLLTIHILGCLRKSFDKQIVMISTVNLGTIKKGIIEKFNVKCINNSNESIRLNEIHKSCDCLEYIDCNNNIIDASDSVYFYFRFKPEGIGYIERNLRFYFDSSKEPYVVKITARIID